MSGVSLEFESPDLAGWLWAAVAVLALAEAVRYVVGGRHPAGRPARATLAGLVAAAVAALKMAGWLRLDASSHGWACVWLAGFGAGWLVRSYGRTTRVISRRVRLTLLALRLAVGFVVIALVAGPVVQTVELRTERAVLGVVLDDSRSMTVRDVVAEAGSSPMSRVEATRAALAGSRDILSRLADRLDVRWFAFDAELRETPSPSLEGRGEFTALADAVERVHALLGQAGRTVAGIIVISDGRDNFSASAEPASAGASLASAGFALYTVGVGSDVPAGQTSGLQARRLDCPSQVAVLNRLPVRADFSAAGLAGTPVDVELLVDDQVADRRQIRPAGIRELISADFSHIPEKGGLYRVTVRASAPSVGQERHQAALSQYVRVADDKIRVLYIDRPRYERAAIARALESAKELTVRKVNLDRPTGAGGSAGLAQADIPWRAYHVVLIGDVERSVFGPGVLEEIRGRVPGDGCGLAMLGGLRTLGSGSYRQTALADLLPVDLAAVGELPGPVSLELTPAGRVHPICQLAEDPAASEEIWKRLAPLAGASRLGQTGPAAEVLIHTADGQALLVVQEAGKGRLAVVAFDSTWRWSFTDEAGSEAQRRFWRQLVLWLARRRPDVWVTTDKPQYDLAWLRTGKKRVLVQAGATDPATGRPAPGVTLTGTIAGPEGESQEISWVIRPEGVEAGLSIDHPGTYHVTVAARSGEEAVAESQTAFVVTSVDVELADPTADIETLKRMADQTGSIGGQYLPLARLRRLLEDIQAAGHVTEITQVRRRDLTREDAWKWLVAFVALVTMEWVVRRRAGLV